ncbi:MAG: hypothetical protein ABI607_14830 [Betaproteobacteria bacterium]
MKFAQRPVAKAINAQRTAFWLTAAAVASAIALSASPARAESTFISGAGTATARLNFSIVIPKFVFLQVGTGSSLATNAAIDTILFDMTGAVTSVGNGTAQAGTGGDLLAGSVTARVLGNNFTAAVNLSATTTGAMSNGTNTISWSEISVAAPTAIAVTPAAASTLSHPGTLLAPFADGAATTVSLTPVARVINQAAKWTFSYKNTNVPPSGTYGNTVANNGQVTYSIAMP